MKNKEQEIQKENSSEKSEKKLEEQRISFSANLISCLEDKKKSFNKRTKSSLKIQQLRDVYFRGVSSAEEDLNLHGLARVNMFLRMREQNKATTTPSNSDPAEKATSLELESAESAKESSPIDISASWRPEEDDVKEAKADIEKFDLNLDFKSLDELYLETYKPIQLEWE